MKLNLKFYKGSDDYSDGDVEKDILSYIKKYPDNYEKGISENNSWPIFYHLSELRNNVINWYPFKKETSILEVGGGMGGVTSALCKKLKKVTTVELSKRRATAIMERNKNANNLEIIVGNFNDIEFKKKYDYILLNGVFEYSALYTNDNNPFECMLNTLKKLLKKDGKILIAIENKMGIKYLAGADEDHTAMSFDGLNGYISGSKIRTFSKNELEMIFENCNLKSNFYYLFPDYKFPKVVYTDEALSRGFYSGYEPYYCKKMNLVIEEKRLYKDFYDNKVLGNFANSFFIEISKDKVDKKVIFAKYNNDYRKDKYNLLTYVQDNMVYKKYLTEYGKYQINNIYNINRYLKNKMVRLPKMFLNDDNVEIEIIDGISFDKILNNLNDNKDVIKKYNEIYDLIKLTLGNKINDINNTIFERYNIDISLDEKKKYTFYDKGLIDVIPNNILIKNKEYYLIDQEWMAENTPIEFLLFHSISNSNLNDDVKMSLYQKYKIDVNLFQKLDDAFVSEIKNERFNYLLKYYRNNRYIYNVCNEYENREKDIVNLQDSISVLNEHIDNLKKDNFDINSCNENLVKEINDLKEYQNNLLNQIDNLNKLYNDIVNSKRWKIIDKIGNIKYKIVK